MVQTGRVHPHSGEEQNKKIKRSDQNLVLQTFSVVSDTHSVAKLTITVNRRDNDMVYSCEVSYGFYLLPITYCRLSIDMVYSCEVSNGYCLILLRFKFFFKRCGSAYWNSQMFTMYWCQNRYRLGIFSRPLTRFHLCPVFQNNIKK